MNRRDFLKAAGLVLAAGAPRYAPGAEKPGPNLLIIQTDEHNFRTLGCYRKTLKPDQAFMWGKKAVVETPNIDWIASNGALCTKFYATTPVCSPSRAAFVSGRYPQNTPVVTNNIALDDNIVTFAEILRRVGYATGYSGKWHLDGNGKPQWGPKRKFGFADNACMFNRGHWKQLEDTASGPRVKARTGGKPSYSVGGADKKSFTTDFLADKTIDFIRKNASRRFCYMVSIPDPHGPDTVRPPYASMYDSMTFEKPRTHDKPDKGLPSWAQKQKGGYGQAKYYGMVKCIDDNVGRILKCLRAQKLMDNTIVIFTADHGDLRGEHHRHNKGVPLEASAKVPFVIYYPAKIKARTIVTQALGTVDFLPTIIGMMGFKTAGLEEGRNASDLFTRGKAPDDWKDVAFVRGTGGPDANWLGAFTGRYKFIVSPRDIPWLIDMEKDPDELKNFFLDPEYRQIVRDLSAQLIEYGRKYKDGRTSVATIKADLDWAANGKGKFTPTARQPRSKAPVGRKRKKNRKPRQ
ncbi:MAG: sulfatase-like hydrolase/transferase [Phycisphaerae bacterium]|nr:sulfatase-like hydrolase/transferase [Phycisphaerae bacterium]